VKVVATYNIKGGVGKTSAAVNFAAIAAGAGLRTLLWDLDPQGAATFLLRIKPKVRGGAAKLVRRAELTGLLRGTDIVGLDLLPADFSYRNMDLVLDATKRPTRRLARLLRPLRADYDLVILDCPPSISLVSESVFDAADALVVPIIPTTLSVRTFDQLVRFTRREVASPPQILGFFSMVDRRKRLHRELVESARGKRRPVLEGAIPASTDVERMGVHRAALVTFAPRSVAARAYVGLWEEISERVGLTPS
jgi:cellulose biosynthesis protein BcsQ